MTRVLAKKSCDSRSGGEVTLPSTVKREGRPTILLGLVSVFSAEEFVSSAEISKKVDRIKNIRRDIINKCPNTMRSRTDLETTAWVDEHSC